MGEETVSKSLKKKKELSTVIPISLILEEW